MTINLILLNFWKSYLSLTYKWLGGTYSDVLFAGFHIRTDSFKINEFDYMSSEWTRNRRKYRKIWRTFVKRLKVWQWRQLRNVLRCSNIFFFRIKVKIVNRFHTAYAPGNKSLFYNFISFIISSTSSIVNYVLLLSHIGQCSLLLRYIWQTGY